MPEDPVKRLRELIAGRRVVFLVGAGVSAQVTGGDPASSWPGFMERGIEAAADLTADAADLHQWLAQVRQEVASRDPDRRLAAEDMIVERLGGRESPAFAQWLADSVGSLSPLDREPIEALAALDVPLLTLNYDDLLEEITGRSLVTWQQPAVMRDVVRGRQEGVIHLHGHWSEPASVVVGTAGYARIASEREAHALVEAVSYGTTLVLVGFGAPLDTEQFEPLRTWLTTSPGERHVRLVSTAERDWFSRPGLVEERRYLDLVEYGPEFDDLAPFLRSLAPLPEERAVDDDAGDVAAGASAGVPGSAAASPHWYRPWGFFFGGLSGVGALYGVLGLLGAAAGVSAVSAGVAATLGDARFAGGRRGGGNLIALLAAVLVALVFAGVAIADNGGTRTGPPGGTAKAPHATSSAAPPGSTGTPTGSSGPPAGSTGTPGSSVTSAPPGAVTREIDWSRGPDSARVLGVLVTIGELDYSADGEDIVRRVTVRYGGERCPRSGAWRNVRTGDRLELTSTRVRYVMLVRWVSVASSTWRTT